MLTEFMLISARLLVGGAFLYSGIQHFFSLAPITEFMRGRAVPYPRQALIAGSVFQSVCGVLVIFNIWMFWATLGLIAFTIAASFIFHNFWDKTGAERNQHLNAALKNIVGIGGMLALALS